MRSVTPIDTENVLDVREIAKRNREKMEQAIGQVALAYALKGRVVLPVHSIREGCCSCANPECPSPGKHPRTERGLKDASKDPAVVKGWWERWPDANVAIVTGAVSGLMVIDIDKHGDVDGEASLAQLEAQHGPLPATLSQRTPSGGRHLFFAYPSRPVRNRARIAPGIDVRGDDGYVVVYPSRGLAGQYQWINTESPASLPDAMA